MTFGIDLWKIVLESNCSEETERDIKIGLDDLYAKARAFDELVKLYPQKDEIPSDEFFEEMERIIKEDD